MSNCKHPTAHPRHKRGAVSTAVPLGKRKTTIDMALSINKYVRKRCKGKVSMIKENDLLCETCYAAELRRWSNKTFIKADSSDDELDASFQSTASSTRSNHKRMRASSPINSSSLEIKLIDPLHEIPMTILEESKINLAFNCSSTDTTSPSDVETKQVFHNQSDKKKFNSLLKVLNVSPLKDA
jgi:hypothetical protein